MRDLRARETNLRNQIETIDTQLTDRETYLQLATDLETFLTQLHTKADHGPPGPRAVLWLRSHDTAATALLVDAHAAAGGMT